MGGVEETKFFREMWSDDISRGQLDGNHTYKWRHFQRIFGKNVKAWIWEDRRATPPEDKEAVHSFIMTHQCQSPLLTHWRSVAHLYLCFLFSFWDISGFQQSSEMTMVWWVSFQRLSCTSVLGWWLFGGPGLNNQTSSSRILLVCIHNEAPTVFALYLGYVILNWDIIAKMFSLSLHALKCASHTNNLHTVNWNYMRSASHSETTLKASVSHLTM